MKCNTVFANLTTDCFLPVCVTLYYIVGSWVTPADRTTDSPSADLVNLQLEKDQKISRLTDELCRLQAIQKDHERKNAKMGEWSFQATVLKKY